MLRTVHGLSRGDIEAFHEEGYLVVENLFSNSDLQPVIDEITGEVMARARRLVDAGKLSSTYEELGFERQLIAIDHEIDLVVGDAEREIPQPADLAMVLEVAEAARYASRHGTLAQFAD